MNLRDEWQTVDSLLDAPAEPIDLRPYQTNTIARVNQSIADGGRRIMLQLATGGGKTLIASTMIAERARNKP